MDQRSDQAAGSVLGQGEAGRQVTTGTRAQRSEKRQQGEHAYETAGGAGADVGEDEQGQEQENVQPQAHDPQENESEEEMRKFQNITRLVARTPLKTMDGRLILTYATKPSMRGMRLLRG